MKIMGRYLLRLRGTFQGRKSFIFRLFWCKVYNILLMWSNNQIICWPRAKSNLIWPCIFGQMTIFLKLTILNKLPFDRPGNCHLPPEEIAFASGEICISSGNCIYPRNICICLREICICLRKNCNLSPGTRESLLWVLIRTNCHLPPGELPFASGEICICPRNICIHHRKHWHLPPGNLHLPPGNSHLPSGKLEFGQTIYLR